MKITAVDSLIAMAMGRKGSCQKRASATERDQFDEMGSSNFGLEKSVDSIKFANKVNILHE